jgi:osmotically-inducible protein OsmY
MKALLLAAALTAAGLSACMRSVDPIDTSDPAIKARIETALRSQPDLDLRALSIDVGSGVVTLSGVLNSRREQDFVTRIARRTKGVDEVLVNIIVPE